MRAMHQKKIMKTFWFGLPKEEMRLIPFDSNLNSKDAKRLLIEQYNFPNAETYLFISNGQVLKGPKPLSSLPDGAKIIVFVKNRIVNPQQNQTDLIKQLNQMYENDNNKIYDLRRLHNMIMENNSLLISLTSEFVKYIIPEVDPEYLFQTFLLLIDIQYNDIIDLQNDYDAEYEQLTYQQKNLINELLHVCDDPLKVLKAAKDSSFDRGEALKLLELN